MKVLILSHNPMSTYQSMGKTFKSLFSAFEPEELCHLYIYPTIPDVDTCSSYYRITDKDVMNSYFHFGRARGREVLHDEIDTQKHEKFESDSVKRLYNRKKNYSTMLARDLMWDLAHYYTSDLKNWLKREKPTCMFLAPGEAKFIYDLAMKIAKDFSIPICTYICDEFYFVKSPRAFLGKIQLSLLQRKIEKQMKSTKAVVTICDALKKQYSDHFKTVCHTIMTGTNYPLAEHVNVSENADSITYMGNLAYNRHLSIAEIGKALDHINEASGSTYKLLLYTGTLTDEAEEAFKDIRSIKFCGFVTGERFDAIFHSAQILLHIEGFDDDSIDRVKNSISTKIADSLSSGIPLLAYGPRQIASIDYLAENHCACVVTQQDQLDTVLSGFLGDHQAQIRFAQAGLALAQSNHQSSLNSQRLYKIMSRI